MLWYAFTIACLRSFAEALHVEDSLSVLVAEEQYWPFCLLSVNND